MLRSLGVSDTGKHLFLSKLTNHYLDPNITPDEYMAQYIRGGDEDDRSLARRKRKEMQEQETPLWEIWRSPQKKAPSQKVA